jgi:hypothetical protein
MPRSSDRAKPHMPQRWLAYGLAFGLGLLAVAWMMPRWALTGGLPPGAPPVADFAQQVVAQRYFLTQGWQWPLLHVERLIAPAGINLAFADGNPLASLAAKLFQPLLPPFVQVATVWLALCWLLQPPAAVFALRGLGERRVWPAIVVAVMALSQPVFLWRIWHNSLASQFAILAMLGLYFRAVAGAGWAMWSASLVTTLLLLVHPYLMVMAMAVLAAVPLTLVARRQKAWRKAAACLGAAVAAVLLVAVLLGYTSGNSPGGYGVFSMNLASPFWPARSGLFPGVPVTAEDATGGQRESYNYLGAGLWLLLLAALTRPHDILAAVKRHAGLSSVLVALTLLALSQRVYLFHTEIWHVRTAVGLLQPLRASGRLFWVVTYTLLIGGAVVLLRGRPRAAMFCLPVAAALQVADGAAIRARDRTMLREPASFMFDPAQVRAVLRTHTRLTILPPFGCTPGHDLGVMQPLWLAAETRMATNTMYLARGNVVRACGLDAAFSHAPGPGEVVMVQPGFVTAAMRAPIAQWCRQAGAYAICAADLPTLAGLAPVSGDIAPQVTPIW